MRSLAPAYRVLVHGRHLSRKPSRGGFNVVASALDLVDDRFHVRCKANAMRLDGGQSQHMAIAVRDENGPVMEVKFSFEIVRKQ